MPAEQILIATSDAQEGEALRSHFVTGQERFQVSCTKNIFAIRRAIDDDSISAIIADATMMPLLMGHSLPGGPQNEMHKPLLLSPEITPSEADISKSTQPQCRNAANQLRLLSNRLNNEIDIWRRSLSDRRLTCPTPHKSFSDSDPTTGFLRRSAVKGFIQDYKTGQERRRIVGCVAIKLDHLAEMPIESSLAMTAVARCAQQRMHKSDVGIRWEHGTLVILRPSSPLGECWLWIQDLIASLQDELSLAAVHSTIGFGAFEVPTADLSQTAINSCVSAANYSIEQHLPSVETPMTTLLGQQEFWKGIQKLKPRARRAQLLKLCNPDLGRTQLEHIGRHCETVSEIAKQIAVSMAFDKKAISDICATGLHHDIGKMLVPNDVLGKPGPLSLGEKQLVGKHVPWGAAICRLLGLNSAICEGVRCHHMRFDDKKSGSSLFGRIINVADSVATMAVRGDYGCAKTLDAIFAELLRERGRQFDPVVVDAMCRLNHSAIPLH